MSRKKEKSFISKWDQALANKLDLNLCQEIAEGCNVQLDDDKGTAFSVYWEDRKDTFQLEKRSPKTRDTDSDEAEGNRKKVDKRSPYKNMAGIIASLKRYEHKEKKEDEQNNEKEAEQNDERKGEPFTVDANDLFNRFQKAFYNRTPIRLVDLYEIFHFTGLTPNELLGNLLWHKVPCSEYQLLDYKSISGKQKEFSEAFRNTALNAERLTYVVRCAPVLGIALTATVKVSGIQYAVLDVSGRFSGSPYYNDETHIVSIPKRRKSTLSDPNLRQEDYNDYEVLYACCVLFALGIFRSESDSKDFLYKDSIVESEARVKRWNEYLIYNQTPMSERSYSLTKTEVTAVTSGEAVKTGEVTLYSMICQETFLRNKAEEDAKKERTSSNLDNKIRNAKRKQSR